jgi:hypothetical protein
MGEAMTEPADREGLFTPAPGAVAVVSSWRGELLGMKSHAGWMVVDGTQTRGLDDNEVSAFRRLIVLDLGKKDAAIVSGLRVAAESGALHPATRLELGYIADQIEAQAKRIEEPRLHGVVVARSLTWDQVPQWTRYTTGDGIREQWIGTNGETAAWRDLIDPVLIRDGIS